MFALTIASLLAAQATLTSASESWLSMKALRSGSQGLASSAAHATYTQDSFCVKRTCVNPIIPGMSFMGESVMELNEQQFWECAQYANKPGLSHVAGFCSRVVHQYPFAIPRGSDDVTEGMRIQIQEKKAMDAYVGHLSAMGHSFWDYTEPWEHDECIQNVWKMACYTHFPRCNALTEGAYLRPCASSCQNYLSACNVECCDEGVQCVFTHTKVTSDGTVVTEEGYVPHHGPSPLCTGGSTRTSPFFAGVMMLAVLWSIGTAAALPRASRC